MAVVALVGFLSKTHGHNRIIGVRFWMDMDVEQAVTLEAIEPMPFGFISKMGRYRVDDSV